MPSLPAASRGLRELLALRPAVPAAALFILGIVLHRIAPHLALVWIGLATLVTVAAVLQLKRSRISSILLAMGLVLAGLASAQLYAFQFPQNGIGAFAGDEQRLADVELEVVTPPRVLTDPFNPSRAMPPKQVLTARVMRLKTWSGWVETSGDMLVQITQPHPQLQARQHIHALGMLQRPAPAMNPGQFDWAHYYRDQRILASFQIPEASNIHILDDGQRSVLDKLREHARRLLALGFPAERALDHALLRALMLGDPDPQLRDVQEQFQRTGTSHHLAISGMHVAVLGGFVLLTCRLLCISPRKAALIALCCVLVYGAAALPSPPVVRSVLLCAAVGFGFVSRRSVDAMQLLAVCVIAMLIYRPMDLYNAGFQLSFGTVLGLILFTEPVLECMSGFRDRDVVIAQSFAAPNKWNLFARWADRKVATSFAAAFVAWLVSMPLIAVHFEQLNPWAVLFSLLLAGFVLIALVAGFCKVLLSLLWPGLASHWAWIAIWPTVWMRKTVEWLASWPRSDVPLPPPPIWLIVAYYGFLLTMLIPLKRTSAIWLLRVLRAAMVVALLWLPYQFDLARRKPPTGSTRITLLAIGAGQCAVVEPPGGRVVLFDAGSNSLNDLVNKCLGPFLRTRGCTNVDSIFLSHADYDHISAVAEVTGAYDVREVLTGAHFADHAHATAPGERMLRTLDELQRPPRVLEPGQRIPLARDTSVEVLWPPTAPPDHLATNDAALVVKLTHAGKSILFTGDIEDAAMRGLLAGDRAKLKSDVLVAPHHGSSESMTAAFVAAVDPQVIVSSNDRSLSRKQVDFEAMIGTRRLLRTHTSGAITIEMSEDGKLTVTPFLQSPPAR